MLEDYKLIKELKKKTQSSFKSLYDKYYRLVYYQAYLILKNKEDSEDVSQNVFIKFFNKIDEIDDKTNLKNYLAKMANNMAIDQFRKNKIIDTPVDGELIADTSNENDLLLNFNGLLEEDENRILILRLNFDYSFKEISEEMNQTIGTIQSKYYKALEKVKAYYKKGN